MRQRWLWVGPLQLPQSNPYYLKRIVGSANNSPRNLVDDIPNEVKGKFNNLKETAEGDPKPERKAATQGVEHASVL